MISIPYMGKVEFLPPHYMVDIQFQFPIMGKVGSKSPFNDLFKQLFQFPIMGKVEEMQRNFKNALKGFQFPIMGKVGMF